MADEELLDPDVVARILSRANELTPGHPGPLRDQSSGVSRAALLAAAEEVGLSLDAVRRSIAIEQLGPLPRSRAVDRIVGRRIVVVDDELRGTPHEVLDRLDGWLVDGHHLRRDRLRDGTGEWSKRTGSVNAVRRSVLSATGSAPLGQFEHIKAAARDSGTGSTVIRVAVDRSSSRRGAAGGGVALAVGGTAGIVVAAVSATPLLLLITPVAVIGGVGVALTGRSKAAKTRLEVERLLESVSQGDEPTRLRNELLKRVTGIGRRSSSAAGQIVPAPPGIPGLPPRIPPPPPPPRAH